MDACLLAVQEGTMSTDMARSSILATMIFFINETFVSNGEAKIESPDDKERSLH